MKALAVGLLCAALAGCIAPLPSATSTPTPTLVASSASPSAVTPPSSPIPLAPDEIPLPTDALRELCGMIGFSAVLHGSATDPHVTWVVNDLGTRIDVVWPPGYRARFTPNLEVLDASGVVVARSGDPVGGGCGTGNPDVVLLEPPLS